MKHRKLAVAAMNIFAIIIGGIALLNMIYHESYQLLAYDLQGGFAYNMSYVKGLVMLATYVTILGGVSMALVWKNSYKLIA